MDVEYFLESCLGGVSGRGLKDRDITIKFGDTESLLTIRG